MCGSRWLGVDEPRFAQDDLRRGEPAEAKSEDIECTPPATPHKVCGVIVHVLYKSAQLHGTCDATDTHIAP